MPLFASNELFNDLITALELQVAERFPTTTTGEGKSSSSGIDVVVGLESRGFLFGPTLALRLEAGFVPVRKQGKLPGETVTEGYQKEYGTDFFQMQKDAIAPGSRVLIVDDIIATGEFQLPLSLCLSFPLPLSPSLFFYICQNSTLRINHTSAYLIGILYYRWQCSSRGQPRAKARC